MKRMILGLLVGMLPALAGPFTPISSPDAGYLASTTYIDFSGYPLYSDYTSISDGVLTVTFSTPVFYVGYTPGGGWATWSEAPYSQRGSGDTLPVLFSNWETSLRMSLSSPVLAFGFEAEPNPGAVYSMTASFYDQGNNLLGTITRDVDGLAGARLFAASMDPIMFVDFTSDVDFGVAAFRYGQVVPEPATWLLLGAGFLGLAALRRRLVQ